jgi:hypothetical protein
MDNALDEHFNLLMSDAHRLGAGTQRLADNNNINNEDIPDNESIFNSTKTKSSISFKNIVYWICIVLLVIVVCVIIYYILCKLFLIVPKEEVKEKDKKGKKEEKKEKKKEKNKKEKKSPKSSSKKSINLKKIRSIVSDLSDLSDISEISSVTSATSCSDLSQEMSTKNKLDLYLNQIAKSESSKIKEVEEDSIKTDSYKSHKQNTNNLNKDLMMELYNESKNNEIIEKDDAKKRRGRPRKNIND